MNAFKQQCIALRKKDYTLNEIVRFTGRPKSSVYPHIISISLSDRKLAKIAENSRRLAKKVAASRKGKAQKPYKPFYAWSPDLVLLAGHLLFDGEIKKSCIYNNRSMALIDRFEDLMKLVYDYEPKRYVNKLTGVRRISFHNVALANHVKEKVQELLIDIVKMPRSHQREFLRAFFDDEGCMDYRAKQNKRRIRGYQKDIKILYLVQELLKNFGIESTLQCKNEVVISGKENLLKFQKEINFSEGVRLNPNRKNSIWKKPIEKRVLLDMAIKSFKN